MGALKTGTDLKRTGVEARRSPRRVFARPVGVLIQGQYHLVQAIEISEGGIRFSSTHRFPTGESVIFTLVMPGGASVVIRGQVIREKAVAQVGSEKLFQYGCQFDDLGLQQRRTIRSYVSAKTQEEAELENDELNY